MLLRNNGDFLRQRGAPPAPVAFPKDYFFLDGMVLFLFSIACLWHAGFGEALSEVPFVASCVIDSEDSKVWAEAIKNVWRKKRKTWLLEAKDLRSSYDEKYSWSTQCKALIKKMIHIVNGMQ